MIELYKKKKKKPVSRGWLEKPDRNWRTDCRHCRHKLRSKDESSVFPCATFRLSWWFDLCCTAYVHINPLTSSCLVNFKALRSGMWLRQTSLPMKAQRLKACLLIRRDRGAEFFFSSADCVRVHLAAFVPPALNSHIRDGTHCLVSTTTPL